MEHPHHVRPSPSPLAVPRLCLHTLLLLLRGLRRGSRFRSHRGLFASEPLRSPRRRHLERLLRLLRLFLSLIRLHRQSPNLLLLLAFLALALDRPLGGLAFRPPPPRALLLRAREVLLERLDGLVDELAVRGAIPARPEPGVAVEAPAAEDRQVLGCATWPPAMPPLLRRGRRTVDRPREEVSEHLLVLLPQRRRQREDRRREEAEYRQGVMRRGRWVDLSLPFHLLPLPLSLSLFR
ncbi:unnamed protein product [Musa acuminata var. zebrina]